MTSIKHPHQMVVEGRVYYHAGNGLYLAYNSDRGTVCELYKGSKCEYEEILFFTIAIARMERKEYPLKNLDMLKLKVEGLKNQSLSKEGDKEDTNMDTSKEITIEDFERQCTLSEFVDTYPQAEIPHDITYYLVGMVNEAGEALGKLKKLMRGDYGSDTTYEWRESVIKELGDTLWYISRAANSLGYSLEEVMRLNMLKTLGRKRRGTERVEGDER